MNKKSSINKKKDQFIKVKLHYILILCLLSGNHFAQNNLFFSKITTNEGLSQNYVQSIFQDTRGFLWFATGDGLNRFDGNKIKIFRNKKNDRGSISDNIIHSIFEDSDSSLWIGTNKGLNKYNYHTEKFEKFFLNNEKLTTLSSDEIRIIFEDSKSNFWVGSTNYGLYKFNKDKVKFTSYVFDYQIQQNKASQAVQTIFEDKNNTIWVGTSGSKGIYKYDNVTDKFDFVELRTNNKSITSSVYDIYEDSKNFFWIGSNVGLIKYDRVNKSTKIYETNINDSRSIINNNINVIYEDSKNSLWIGSLGGASKFNYEKETFTNFVHDQNIDKTISNDNVLTILEDKSSVLWFGTATGGLNKVRNKKNIFQHYYHLPSDPNSLSENTVRAIYSDEDNDLWIGTLGGGINLKINNENNFFKIKNNRLKNNSLSLDQVSSIYLDDDGKLWVGTWKGGLNVLPDAKNAIINSGELKFTIYVNDAKNNKSIADNTIQWIFEDSQGRMWIATGLGLDLYNSETNEFFHIQQNTIKNKSITDNRVQSKGIIEDKFGNIWVGTWNGLNRITTNRSNDYSKVVDRITQIYNNENDTNSLSNNRIISIENDSKGNLWFGTYGGGLNKLDSKYLNEEEFVFKHWNENDGLANNIIYGIEEDNNGNLWLGTNNGLSKFNPRIKKFKNYYKIHGLQNNQFFWGASCSGKDGSLQFGGINGLNIFHPDSIAEVESHYNPPLYITDFKKFGTTFKFDTSITTKKRINLSYRDNFFTFVYSAMDFNDPAKIKYAYKLEGFDDDWRYVGNQNMANYTNISGGEYIFTVKSTNSDGVWSDKITKVRVSIDPPFWETWWLKLLVILTFVSFIFLFNNYKVKSYNKRNKLLDQEVKKRTEELSKEIAERKRTEEILRNNEKELNSLIASKDKFFSIISHDLRSPFSALLGVINLLVSDFDNLTREEKIEYINSIEKSSKNVFNLLENLLEWSRVHTGAIEFNPKISYLSVIVKEVIDLLEINANNKNITLEHDIDERLYFYGDINMIYTILRNIVSNAIKFTNIAGIVNISANKEKDMIRLEIKDNGVGMDSQTLENIFSIDVSHSTFGTSGEKGTGLGLLLSKDLIEKNNGRIEVLSTPNEGTTFRLFIPTGIN